jgi:hypothetical protein
MGAPIGNTNPTKGKRWQQAIDRALAERSKRSGIEALDELAEKLLILADGGDLGALRELADRLDGKAIQQIDANVDTALTVEILKFADSPAK